MADTIELSRDVRDHLASHPLRVGRMALLTSAGDKAASSEQTNQPDAKTQITYPKVLEFLGVNAQPRAFGA